MKRVKVERHGEAVLKFIRSLPVDKDGCVLELDGKPILQVLPYTVVHVDEVKLTAAIRRRRDESRRLNADWEHVDREMWDRIDKDEA